MGPKKIQELVKIVEQSNIDELEITRWWGHKIRIKKTGTGVFARPQETPPAGQLSNSGSATIHEEKIQKTQEQAPAEVNVVKIRAPMVGTFYRASAPDAEPFVREGDVISPGQTLCIIEAMKLMNEIEAEQSGRIVEILAESAQPVEYNQPLFILEPTS